MVRDAGGEAKVDELDIFVLVEENILKFDISMSNTFAMTIFERNHDLFENTARFFLLELLVYHFFQIGVQAAAADILHDQVHM